MPSRASHLLGAYHSFGPYPYRHLVSWLPTMCQSRLLGRLVRSFVKYLRGPLSTHFHLFFFFHHLRDGFRTCDGLSNTARIVIGVVIGMYPHYPVYLFTNPRFPGTPSTGSSTTCAYFSRRRSRHHLRLVRISETAYQPPGQSSLHPTDSTGKWGRVWSRWWSNAVWAAAPAPSAQ